jgi:hypothetical protein
MKGSWTLAASLCVTLAHGALFDTPDIQLELSPKLKERIAIKDSLLPTFNAEQQLGTLLRSQPKLWQVQDLADSMEIATKLRVTFEFVDGSREEQDCRVLGIRKDSNDIPLEWNLKIGVDFISAGSNIVGAHIQQCMDAAREQMGLAVRRGEQIVYVPPKKEVEDLSKYRVNNDLPYKEQRRVKLIEEEIARTRSCPKDIQSYVTLLDIWKGLSNARWTLEQIQQELNSELNGGRKVTSCSFSREWNQRYSSETDLRCDLKDESCVQWKSSDGRRAWKYNAAQDALSYQGWGLWGLRLGQQSIHKGGRVLDVRWLPLSRNLYLEAYLDAKGQPVTLGYLMIHP